MNTTVDEAFVKAMPKAELHAHLTGSVNPRFMHELWVSKTAKGECAGLEDPLTAICHGNEINVVTFFPLFDKYIYQLINDAETVKAATRSVINDFAADGVAYLELRTTPREHVATGLTKQAYVRAVHEVIAAHNTSGNARIEVRLILSVDRKMTAKQAEEVVDLALEYQYVEAAYSGALPGAGKPGCVVGVDICGNPLKGDITIFTTAFQRAKARGLGVTVHFAEVPHSSSESELQTLLSWQPDRLGHVINVPDHHKRSVEELRLGLELCLSCNVLAKLTSGGFAMHHFGEWMKTACPIALSTDDMGVFSSPLSKEYLLAAKYFGLTTVDLVNLSKSAVSAAFTGKDRMLSIINEFKRQYDEPSGTSNSASTSIRTIPQI